MARSCASGWRDGCAGRPFAVRACSRRTAKSPGRRTATTAARQRVDARQRTALGKGAQRTTKKSSTAKASAHGKVLKHGKEEKRTATFAGHGKGLSRAYTVERTAKVALPFVTLPWARCRASTHGKDFAVSFDAFAVPQPHTATPLFPVVCGRW
jgi:hypothetical protein